ncbi:MAG: HAD family hydrolase [Candidatus Gracilibacteria bacterium]|nr:HAD family hydrolase [Candidatus Gracilibacteria bacterium]
MKDIIFDFDGVIVDSFGFHVENIRDFYELDFHENDLKDMQNGNIFDSHSYKVLEEKGWDGYKVHIYNNYTKLPIDESIKDVLLKLKDDYRLHIITSGGANNVCGLLKNNDLYEIFDEILCHEFHKSKIYKFNYLFDKYDFSPSESIFITDTLGDILEANEVGIKSIAVDFGYHEKERLDKGNPYKIISSFDELLEIS